MSKGVFLKHPVFERDESLVTVSYSAVDSAGYRQIGDLVHQFTQAGIQLHIFRAAEFAGDMSVSPMHRAFIDPVDRDKALLEAAERGKKARADYEVARRAALDKREQAIQTEIERVAERLRRSKDASSTQQSSVSSQVVPKAE